MLAIVNGHIRTTFPFFNPTVFPTKNETIRQAIGVLVRFLKKKKKKLELPLVFGVDARPRLLAGCNLLPER